MSFVWNTAAKDLKRNLADPVGLISWIGLPLVVGILLMLMAGGDDGPQPRAKVLVADEDDTFLTNLLVGALSQDAAGGLIRAEEVAREEGRARMEEGKASALLIIPEGFARAALEETPATLELVTNPAQRILPGIVEEGLGVFVDGMFYLQRLLGDDLRAFAQGPDSGNTFPDERIAEFSVTVNRIVDRVGNRLSPPAIGLVTAPLEEADEDEEESPSLSLLFVPGLLLMSLLMMAQGSSADLWKERDGRTLRRMLVTPRRVSAFLAGKLLAGAVVMGAVSGIVLTIVWVRFAIPFRTLPFAVAWAAFSGVTLTTFMTVLQLWLSTRRAANVVSLLVMFPLLMVGGSFFPFEAMPPGLAAIGRATPNGWALEQLKAIILRRVVPEELAASFVLLLVVGVALFFVNARRLRAGFAQG